MKTEFFNGRVLVKAGDITVETTEGIVNAANSTILAGGGEEFAVGRFPVDFYRSVFFSKTRSGPRLFDCNQGVSRARYFD